VTPQVVAKEQDAVLAALRALPAEAPCAALSARIRAAGHARLRPLPLHPLWGFAVLASVLAYLGWALAFTGPL
jgi:hypothetical protein